MKRFLFVPFFLLLVTSGLADIKVATLHPLISDLANQVGGNHVKVVSLMKVGADPHNFTPTPGQLASVADAQLILASGKGLETYLDKVEDNLASGQRLVEVGRRVPSLKISGQDELFVCCPAHSQGGIDPHWWHSIDAMKRATLILADEFSQTDPANAASYKANADVYRAKLDQLDSWAKQQIARIPRSDRKLTTSHLAFGYFCRDYGFKALPVQGLSREQDPSPGYLATTIAEIEKQKIPAVFPEQLANPKVLQAMVEQTGVTLGGELIADGTVSSFEKMFKHNVSTIVAGLTKN